jgi:hypothetical protein
MMRKKILAAAAVCVLASASFALAAQADAAPAGSGSATYGEIELDYAPGWCVTAESLTVGALVVLGRCANAQTQEFSLAGAYSDDPVGEIEAEFGSGTLCLTVPDADHQPDGQIVKLGNCVDDVSQIFAYDGEYTWYMPDEVDSNGHNLALDDKNDVLGAYNPIDTSYYCPSCHSEDWVGPPYYS